MDISNLEKWHFEITEEPANYLLELVLKGKKKSTASSLRGYEIEGSPIPKVGERSVLTYWDGTPDCMIETTNVRIIPYCEITYDIAKLEGEDDTLESWQKNHQRFFTEEGLKIANYGRMGNPLKKYIMKQDFVLLRQKKPGGQRIIFKLTGVRTYV